MAAAVVKEPAGSANTETWNGGNIALRAAASMSSARIAFLPPMKMPVRRAPLGPREKIASCVRSGDLAELDGRVGHGGREAGVERHVHVERADMLQRAQHVQDVRSLHGVSSPCVGRPGRASCGAVLSGSNAEDKGQCAARLSARPA